MSATPFGRDERPSTSRCGGEERRACEHADLDRTERQRERIDRPRENRNGRDQEHGHLGARREGDLRRELDVAAARDDHGTAVLRSVADDRDDDRGDEEVAEAGRVGERLERADEHLRDERGDDRRGAEHGSACRKDHRPSQPGPRSRGARGGVERAPCGDHVDGEQDDRRPASEVTCERVPLGIAVPARDRRDRERQTASATSPIEVKLDVRSIGPRPPSASEKPSTSRRLPTTLPVSDPRTTSGQAFVDRDQGDDQLGRVAERRIEEPADARPRVVGSVLGGLADQPCERNERDRRRARTRPSSPMSRPRSGER